MRANTPTYRSHDSPSTRATRCPVTPSTSGMFVANLPARWVYAALSGGSAFGAAFPSSHVAATVAATIGAWRGSRRLGMILAVPTGLLMPCGLVTVNVRAPVVAPVATVTVEVSWVALT